MKNKFFTTVGTNKKLVYCPLDSLIPDGIKKCYDNNLNKTIIKRKYYYPNSAKILGFETTWSNYINEFNNNIKRFMKENGLVHFNQDILNTSYPFKFSYRNIADRLFLSNKKTPKAIFTGYKNELLGSQSINDYFHQINMLISDKKIQNYPFYPSIQKFIYDLFQNNNDDFLELLVHNRFENGFDIKSSIHLIGDLCIKNYPEVKDELFFQLYKREKGLITHSEEHLKLLQILKEVLVTQEDGWIDVIPYNDNLIFLKAQDGSYDFVFRNLRDEKFISPFKNFLKQDDTPSSINEELDFDFWLYHGRNHAKQSIQNLWKEKDEHLAEIEFYKNATSEEYHGLKKILKKYYENQGLYSYPNSKKNNGTHRHPDYEVIEFPDKTLCVSQLVTISDFFEFYNSGFKERRSKELDEIYSNNFERPDYPVSVTWYDAVAYCKYLQEKSEKQIRLLTPKEFEFISPKIKIDNQIKPEQELIYSYDYQEFNYPAPHVEKYENLMMKFAKPLEFKEHNQLIFPLNSRFKEWSNDFINNHVSLLSAHDDHNIKNYKLLASSNNKYKYLKVGFRVCYEVSKDAQ